jgi:hypothetical protein
LFNIKYHGRIVNKFLSAALLRETKRVLDIKSGTLIASPKSSKNISCVSAGTGG